MRVIELEDKIIVEEIPDYQPISISIKWLYIRHWTVKSSFH